VKDACGDRDRLYLVIPADAACAELAQAGANAFDVGEDQPVLAAASNEGVEDGRLRKTKG
jgi:hypothetical protein